MEWAEKGQVMKLMNADASANPLPLDKAWKYFRDLISGLEYRTLNRAV